MGQPICAQAADISAIMGTRLADRLGIVCVRTGGNQATRLAIDGGKADGGVDESDVTAMQAQIGGDTGGGTHNPGPEEPRGFIAH